MWVYTAHMKCMDPMTVSNELMLMIQEAANKNPIVIIFCGLFFLYI